MTNLKSFRTYWKECEKSQNATRFLNRRFSPHFEMTPAWLFFKLTRRSMMNPESMSFRPNGRNLKYKWISQSSLRSSSRNDPLKHLAQLPQSHYHHNVISNPCPEHARELKECEKSQTQLDFSVAALLRNDELKHLCHRLNRPIQISIAEGIV